MFNLRSLKNILGASLVLSAIAAAPSGAQAAGYANPTLLTSTEELQRIVPRADVRVIDVRPASAYREGHIPGAVHLGADDVVDPTSPIKGALLPMSTLVEMLEERGIGNDTRVILYDDVGGFHASRLFWMLEYFGHRNVSILNGGMPRWTHDGGMVSTMVPEVRRARFTLAMTPRRVATADWLLDRAGDPSVVVIDVRPPKTYRAGHIPWARNVPWVRNLNVDGTMKPADALLTQFEASGVTRNKNVAVHCQVGKAAAHTYFTLRLLGYPRVRSYDRSWAEWGSADDLPKTADTRG